MASCQCSILLIQYAGHPLYQTFQGKLYQESKYKLYLCVHDVFVCVVKTEKYYSSNSVRKAIIRITVLMYILRSLDTKLLP